MLTIAGAYGAADLAAARRTARVAREKAARYRGSSAQMRRKLEARAAMAETEMKLIAYALAQTAQETAGGRDGEPARAS